MSPPTIGSTSDYTTASVSISSASAPTITNLSMPLADTEYSVALQSNVRAFEFQLRSSDGPLRFAFVLGDTATNYFTLAKGCTYFRDGVQLSGKTLYVRTNKAGQTLELLEWV